MKRLTQIIFSILLLVQLPLIVVAENNYLSSTQLMIDSNKAPEGVVFEIVNRDKKHLDWALAETERLSRQLREKYPDLAIAVVTHGSEQFALTKKQLANNAPLNNIVESLNSSNVQIHVCGTHAERKGIESEEFSELVDVAAEGPAQINDYINLGYVKIKLVKN